MSDARKNPIISVALWDVGLVLATYFVCRWMGLDGYIALLAATATALVRTGYVMISQRSFDGFSAIMCLLFGAGLALSFVTGEERLLLATKSIVTAVLAVVVLGSTFVGRPVAFGVAKHFGARGDAERQRWNHLYAAVPTFQRIYFAMTYVWAAVLMFESVLRLPIIYLLPIDAAVPASSVLLLLSISLTFWWSAWYGGRGERRVRPDAV